jgi:hypothetical protein
MELMTYTGHLALYLTYYLNMGGWGEVDVLCQQELTLLAVTHAT